MRISHGTSGGNPNVAVSVLHPSERSKLFLGRQGEATIIAESALYKLIMRSNKPEAKVLTCR